MVITLALLYGGDGIAKYLLHQKMVEYSIISAREDGAENRVILLGKPGTFGHTMRLSYLEDGFIRLIGNNSEGNNNWKLISKFILEPGVYSFTGMRRPDNNTVALQLHIENDNGFSRYIYQWNEDVHFQIDQEVRATLHVMIYPKVEELDIKVRPAVYRDE